MVQTDDGSCDVKDMRTLNGKDQGAAAFDVVDDGPSTPVQNTSKEPLIIRYTASSSHAICIENIPPAVP